MVDVQSELTALRDELEQLKSKDQIRQQLVRYARALEWLDASLLKEVYHEDAYVDFGFFKGSFADYWADVIEHERTQDATFHLCATAQIELAGEIAEVESYGIAMGRTASAVSLFGGRYLDRFTRKNGIWKIARRLFLLDWNTEYRGEADVGDFLTGINMVKDRSPAHPLFRRLGVATS